MRPKVSKKTEYHSEDMEDIISKSPTWLLKWGITSIFLIIFIMLTLSAYIKYPEIIASEMKITTLNAPKTIASRVNGSISFIEVADGTQVIKDQVLGVMENTANYKHVLKLINLLTEVSSKNGEVRDEISLLISTSDLQLGELQPAYQTFYQTFLTYRSVKTDGFSLEKRKMVEQELENIALQKDRITEYYNLQSREVELAKDEYEKYKSLAEKKIISPMELKKQEVILLAKLQSIPQSENTILSNQAASISRRKELAELDKIIEEEQKKFIQAIKLLLSEAITWKQRYVLVAPVNGKVIYGSSLQENQNFQLNDPIFYIYNETDKYFGELKIPQINFGRIKEGQDVLIKLSNYPYHEYGHLEGKIKTISDIPVKDSVFHSTVSISRTSKDSIILLRPGIVANAEIITDNQSILYRIFKSMIRRQ